MTVEELDRRLSLDELTEWMAHDKLREEAAEE